jgi:outer membrane receptor for ferrienterochelin and colicin
MFLPSAVSPRRGCRSVGHRLRSRGSSFAIGLCSGHGTPTPQRLDPLSVTATRGLQPSIDLLADVTVIGRDEIARSGVQSLAELLQRQPGAEIVQNGGPASVSGVFLRGANTAQTLVLVDGVRHVVDDRRDRARSDTARSDRAHRCCADPRRVSTAPTRSAV